MVTVSSVIIIGSALTYMALAYLAVISLVAGLAIVHAVECIRHTHSEPIELVLGIQPVFKYHEYQAWPIEEPATFESITEKHGNVVCCGEEIKPW